MEKHNKPMEADFNPCSLVGEPDNFQPFGFLLKGFYFFDYFPEKEGF